MGPQRQDWPRLLPWRSCCEAVAPEAMALSTRRALRRQPRSLLGATAAALLAPVLDPSAALAQQQGYGQTMGTSPMERQLYDSNPRGGGGSGSPLESGNPLDILNAIRRNSSLSDATPPASAIDDALKEFDARPVPAPAPAGPKLPGP
jgi:hypothetical protein